MKTSTRILIAALVFLLASILAYDLLLKKEFLTGNYKKIYASYVKLDYKNFDALQINASQKASVQVVQGPYGIQVDPHVLEYVHFTQTGKRLQMDVTYSAERFYTDENYRVIISCPRLTTLNASAFTTINKQIVIDTAANDNWNYGRLTIQGFKQDSLRITQDYGSNLFMTNNTIGTLKVTAGVSPLSGSRVTILKNNRFDKATLQLLNNSKLFLHEAQISKLDYQPGDSTQLVLNGAAKKALLPNIYPKQ